MKPSFYNITTTDPDTGDVILFNTLYGSTVSISNDEASAVTTLLARNKINIHNGRYTKLIEYLARGKFLIDDAVDEIEIVRNRKRRGMQDRNRADVIIMPNMDCNFACPYCYERHDHRKRLSKTTEESIKAWLRTVIDDHKLVLLNWFGGEPLLSYKSILSIGAYALEYSTKQNVSLLSNITTNGYSFTDRLIKQLISINIHSYQITIDGPPRYHNKTRVLRSGKDTFDRILHNVIALAEASKKTKISTRVNFNHTNIYDIPELLSLLPSHIRPQLRIVFEPIFGESDQSATKNLPGTEISRAITDYYKLAEKMGFDVVYGGLGVGKLCYCYAEREHQYIVDYNANVFKCSVSSFEPSERVGFITRDGQLIRDRRQWNKWFEMELFEEECEECRFLPLCMGGCRKDRVENRCTGSYCHLIPTNTSNALKSIAFGNFSEFLNREVEVSRSCAIN